MNKNCYNSRTSDDIDIKLEPPSKLEKSYTMASTKFDNDFILANYDNLQTIAIRKPDSDAWYIIIKFSLITTFYITKAEQGTRKSLIQSSYYCLEKYFIFT